MVSSKLEKAEENPIEKMATSVYHHLVKSSPSWVGDIHELLSTMWSAALKTAESIRTGSP